jgi:hypothetical protein
MQFNEPTYTFPQSLINDIVAKLDMQPCGAVRHTVNAIEQLCQIQNNEKDVERLEQAVKAAQASDQQGKQA